MTTDREAERLQRIRERAFYLSQIRQGPPNPVADWIEAEAAEAAAETVSIDPSPPEPAPPEPPLPEPPPPEPPAPDPLARYPHIAAALARSGTELPPGRLDDDAALDRLDRDLGVLAARLRPEDMTRLGDELVRTVADDLQAELSWELAAMQIHLFAELARRNCLQSIGARPAWSLATTAPFRCTIGAKGASVSVEVQPELGTGLGAPPSEGGPVSQRAGSDESPESVTPFPRHLLPPFKKLLETRAKEDAPFLLATVRSPAAPAEAEATLPTTLELVAKKASAGAASLANSASSLWLGLLELDLRAESRLRLVIRPAASWPLPYRDLAASLDASITVL